MMNWWERPEDSDQGPQFAYRAVAYYRHSAQDRQENSIAIQQDQVRSWAKSNGVEIIHEFTDPGKSGLTAEDRPGFQDMMESWVKKKMTSSWRTRRPPIAIALAASRSTCSANSRSLTTYFPSARRSRAASPCDLARISPSLELSNRSFSAPWFVNLSSFVFS